jgi:hypothetical protein
MLLQALEETRHLLAREGNDFAWSAWRDGEAALKEMDTMIECIRGGAVPDAIQLAVLFAPTGPVQEVSISSGWADAFLELADRVDEALRES